MFEEKHKLAKKDSSELRGIIKHLSSVDWQKKLVHGQEALTEISEEMLEQIDRCAKLKNRIETLNSEQQIVQDQLKSVENGWYNISEVETSIEIKSINLSSSKNKIAESGSKKLEIEEEIQELQRVVSLIDSDHLKLQLDKHSQLKSEKSSVESDLKAVRSKLKSFNKKIKLLETHEYDPDCCFCANNEFVKEAHNAKKKAPELVKEIASLEDNISALHKSMMSLSIENVKERLQQYDTSVKKIQKLQNRVEKLESNVKVLTAENELLENQVSELVKKRDHYYENQEAFENIDSLKRDLRAMNIKTNELSGLLKRCEKKIMSLNSEEGATRQQVKEAESKLNEIKSFERDYIAYDLFIQAMHPNGVSYQVIKSMLSIINFEISKILNNIVDFEVFFDNIGSKLEIYIKHPRFDPRPLSMGSGAEKTIASMAIRLALISITNLPKSELFILDEPATALDAEHMDGFIRLLQMIKSQFKTVLLISHLESLKDIVDMTIDITKKDGYAHVKI